MIPASDGPASAEMFSRWRFWLTPGMLHLLLLPVPSLPAPLPLVPAVPRQAVGVCMGTVQTVCRCGVPWLGPSCTSCYSGHRAESCGSVCTAKLGAEGKCWSIGSCVDSAALYLSPCTALALQVLDEIHHLTLAPVAASVR